jgi:hypothetical protein
VSSVTYNSTRKPFQVVQAPHDLVKTDSMYLLADSDTQILDAQNDIRKQVDDMQKDANDKVDRQKGPQGQLSRDKQQKKK